jgi:hypothetical protein
MTKCLLWGLLCFGFALAQDTSKPLVTLGVSTTSIVRPTTLNLSANALDSGGIQRVEFYQNGVKVHEEFEAPFEFSMAVTQGDNGTLEFYAIAYDNAGNSNSSSAMTVTVNIAAPVLKGGDDFFTTLVNTPLDIGVNGNLPALKVQANLLQNDNLDGARIAGSSNVVGGSLELSPTGGFVFIPDDGFIGTAGFDYTIDSSAGKASASVRITVQEANADVAGDQRVWYVRSGTSSGSGSAAKPFATLQEAESASQDGDIIFVLSGTYECEDVCFNLKPFQTLMGAASFIDVDDAQLGGGEPSVLNATSTGIALSNQSSVKGLNIQFSGQQRGIGILGSDVLTGSLLIEDVSIDNPGGFGILMSESDAKDAATGAKHNLTIKNVTINNPGQMGILSNDALNVSIDTCLVNGVVRHPEDGFSGRGILIESEFNTSIVVSNTTVSSASSDEVVGLYILKNNAFGNAAIPTNLNVVLNSNTVSLGANGLAYKVEAFAGTADFPADTGGITLSGTRNASPNAQAVVIVVGSARVQGSVEVNGVIYPQ